ncbi:hypothetical protein COLO4_16951 [Corchorus olitorius]|uniref:Uncharacterized protein n=1 Tax=Corchorus olitorius TaxID=93759 RepID=A0A1R3JEX1_9ROSI|nr:hypothetical protein COLO4_16951 [Corchorus olitorius]
MARVNKTRQQTERGTSLSVRVDATDRPPRNRADRRR